MTPSRAILVACLLALLPGSDAKGQASIPFDRSAWEADYAALKRALELGHSHLAWFGSPQGGVDLPSLDRLTRESLGKARTDAEASAAILRFVTGLHDGHITQVPPTTGVTATSEPPAVTAAKDAHTACAAFGYAPITRVAFSLPWESLPGFELLTDGLTGAFRAGVIEQSGRRIGIVRIPRFRSAEFPSLCENVWNDLRSDTHLPTNSEVLDRIDGEWLRTLAERLRELRARGTTALLVDIGGNGGGNELGDWAVRLFTRSAVSSAPLFMAASSAAVPYFDEQVHDLKAALDSTPRSDRSTRIALEQQLASFQHRKEAVAKTPCDMSWVWRERRSWGTSLCTRLIDAGFASGALGYSEPGTFPETSARALYWASRADSLRGAWDGPTFVFTNANTGSAAEMFAALIRDRGIAKIIGTRTFGLGCGFMDNAGPVVLPHSRLAFRIPNCVRLRGDGTDEVAGIAPDIPMSQDPGESARSLAWRTLQAIAR